MNTSKYEADDRRQTKIEQRSPAYRALQQRTAAERAQLERKLQARERKLQERDAAIARLKQKLVETGVSADLVEQLAA